MVYFQHNYFFEILKSVYWFLQIVDRDSGNIYPLFPCSDFVSQMCVGGGGDNVFLAFYANI